MPLEIEKLPILDLCHEFAKPMLYHNRSTERERAGLELVSPRTGNETEKVPRTLEAALQALEADEVMKSALGSSFVDYFCSVKREGEIDQLPLSDMSKEGDEVAFAAEREMYAKFM